MIPTLICLGVGIVLMIGEMFTPGMGAMGILGAIALLAAIMLQISNPVGILFMAALVLFILALGLLLFFRLASRGRFDKSRIVLKESIDAQSNNLSSPGYQAYIGSIGTAATPLRPAGKAVFDGETLDVVTSGEFLPEGAAVQVASAQGLRIVVHAVSAQE